MLAVLVCFDACGLVSLGVAHDEERPVGVWLPRLVRRSQRLVGEIVGILEFADLRSHREVNVEVIHFVGGTGLLTIRDIISPHILTMVTPFRLPIASVDRAVAYRPSVATVHLEHAPLFGQQVVAHIGFIIGNRTILVVQNAPANVSGGRAQCDPIVPYAIGLIAVAHQIRVTGPVFHSVLTLRNQRDASTRAR